MNLKDIANEALGFIQSAGLEKAQVSVSESDVQELELNESVVNLCRSTSNFSISLKAVHDSRQYQVSGNSWNEVTKKSLMAELQEGLKASSQDEAYDILPESYKKEFSGPMNSIDMKEALSKIMEHSKSVAKRFPKLRIRTFPFQVVHDKSVLVNSNGLELSQEESYCDYTSMFSGEDDGKVGSFNYVGRTTRTLPKDFSEGIRLDHLYDLAEKEPHAIAYDQEVKGDLILTPYVIPSFLSFILSQLSSSSLISGSSLFKDRLGKEILSKKFTLSSDPFGQNFGSDAPFNSEGVLLEKGNIIEEGKLNQFLLDVYGSKKLKLPISKVTATHLSIAPGDSSLEDLIKNTKKGLLLLRFSGGSPSANGDFSGVAKNSFLIEDGKISMPIKEAMISGNIVDVFNQITEVSKDVVSNGRTIYPWLKSRL